MTRQKQTYFLKLYEPIHDRFERFCRARAYGDMPFEDLINETLLVAFQKLDTLKSEGAFLAFLCGIAIRLLSNTNKKKRDEVLLEQDVVNNFSDLNANATQDAEVYLLHKALALLNTEQRESLILFEIIGFSIKEVAVMHKVSESAVKQRLKRGRERLTQILTFESEHKVGRANNGS